MSNETLHQYAPVLIITLCRDEHLRKSVESLALNAYAERTDLYIALDYPSKEQHWTGYNKICQYVDTIKGFKSVTVIKRPYNFGSARNLLSARKYIVSKYDRYIFSDDDNIFSPNFLEYINKGLDKFKNDKSVYAISGYSYYDDIQHDDNNFYRQRMGLPVWGYAEWRSKSNEFERKFTKSYCITKLINPCTFFKAFLHSKSTFLFLLLGAIKSTKYNDNSMTVYMFFEQKDVVLPVLSKVRNIGFDGSGEHCGINNEFMKREIDENLSFEYKGDGFEYYDEINKRLLAGKRQYITTAKMISHIFAMTASLLKRKLKR